MEKQECQHLKCLDEMYKYLLQPLHQQTPTSLSGYKPTGKEVSFPSLKPDQEEWWDSHSFFMSKSCHKEQQMGTGSQGNAAPEKGSLLSSQKYRSSPCCGNTMKRSLPQVIHSIIQSNNVENHVGSAVLVNAVHGCNCTPKPLIRGCNDHSNILVIALIYQPLGSCRNEIYRLKS